MVAHYPEEQRVGGFLAVDSAVGLAILLRDEGGLQLFVFLLNSPIQKAKNRTGGEFGLIILEFGILYFSVLHSYIKGFDSADCGDSLKKLLYCSIWLSQLFIGEL